MTTQSKPAAVKAPANAKAKAPTKAQRIASGAAKAKGRSFQRSMKDEAKGLSLDDVLLSYVKDVGKETETAWSVAMRLFRQFDDWDCNDPASHKPKIGLAWCESIDGSAYTDNEVARKNALLEVKGKVKDMAVLHCPSNINSPWSRIMAAAKQMLNRPSGARTKVKTSNAAAKEDLLRAYKRFMKDNSLNDEGQSLNIAIGELLVRYFQVDITKY